MFRTPLRRLAPALLGALAIFASLAAPNAQATKLQKQNLTQLISESQSIISGTVKTVTDGIDERGIPYTEVTIAINSSAKGNHQASSDYTFRQFGLLTPKKAANGHEFIAVAPEGFPRWHQGETVVAFLYKPAELTGLQTTAGLAQGKLSLVNGLLANEFDNAGLFEGVEIDSENLTPAELTMMDTEGAVDAKTFMGLVDRAVSENWIASGEMQ